MAAAAMSVPEAAMNEHHDAAAGKDDVRRAREVASVHAEAIAHPAQERADRKLRSGVLPPDAGHHSAPLGGGEGVDHGDARRRGG